MTKFRYALLASVTILAAACSENDQTEVLERVSSVDIAEPPPPAAMIAADAVAEETASAEAPTASGSSLEVSQPQIAYRYGMGFRVPSTAIKPLQERHADMCEARGPDVCRIISMNQNEGAGDYAYGSLQLAVATKQARAFTKGLEQASGDVEGELISSSISGEDLSKRIVDTEARLRARTVLRDRLMQVLRTRTGTVKELVEAERGVAQVNEEIDQARSWLSEMRGRVAYSQVEISYESGARASGSQNSNSFSDPIRSAWGSIGGILGGMIGFLILALTILIPIGLLGWVIWRVWTEIRPKRSTDEPVVSKTIEETES